MLATYLSYRALMTIIALRSMLLWLHCWCFCHCCCCSMLCLWVLVLRSPNASGS